MDGKVYAVGGGVGYPPTTYDKVEEYDLIADSWVTKTPMKIACIGHAAEVVNGKIYIMGGRGSGEASVDNVYNGVYEYEPRLEQ